MALSRDLEEERRDFLLGRMALERGLITQEQLREALAEQSEGVARGRKRPRPIGVILACKRYITDDQLLQLMKEQDARLANEEARRERDKLLGELLIERGRVTCGQVEECLRAQLEAMIGGVGEFPGLGDLLVQKGYATPAVISQALALQDKTILSCVSCGKRYNVRGFRPDRTYRCLECRGLLEALTVINLARVDVEDEVDSTELEVGASEPAPKEAGEQAEKPVEPSNILVSPAEPPPAPAESAEPPARGREALPESLGKYRFVRELGRGAMGVVYEALDTQLERRVALKLMLTTPGTDADELAQDEERFVREAQLSAQLPKHPNIVTVYEAGVIDRRRYIAMEIVDGESMFAWRRKGSVTIRQQVRVLRDVALAVHHSHEHGILHRDLKPGNVLMGPKNQPFVTDFGLAKTAGHDVRASLTISGLIVGTPSYMSPEQAHGSKKIDRRADVYSLGVMLYEILTGRPPFRGQSPMEVLAKVLKDPVVPPSSVVKSPGNRLVDSSIENICLRTLAKKPKDRYPSAKAFADDLTRWLKGEEVKVAPPQPKVTRTQLLIASAAALLLLALVGALLFGGRPSASRDLARARKALKAGEIGEARLAFEGALKKDPQNPEALSGLKEVGAMERQRALELELQGALKEVAKLRQETANSGSAGALEQIRAWEDRARRAEAQLKEISAQKAVAAPASSGPSAPGSAAGETSPLTSAPPKALPLPPPAILSKEAQAYRIVWDQAMGLAAARDYAGAIAKLGGVVGGLQETELYREGAADLEAFRSVRAIHDEALRLLAESPSGRRLSLTFVDETGSLLAVESPVVRSGRARVELQGAAGSKTTFVEFTDVVGESLARVFRGAKPAISEAERRGLAILCLLEGGVEAAEAQLEGRTEILPAKYRAYVPAPATSRARPDAREYEARRTFYEAEREFRPMVTRTDAVAKYKHLLEEYFGTRFVLENREAIVAGSEACKDYVFFAHDLRGTGTFRLARHPKVESCWASEADTPSGRERDNYVEVEFAALSQTAYRCWVYAGACCAETFEFWIQGSELTGPGPRLLEKVGMEPGSNYAMDVKAPIPSLKPRHAAHGGRKEPTRWDWIALPLPKYAAPGAKKVRLISGQQGFSVSHVVVSSTRAGPPTEAETRDLLHAKPPERKGLPDPAEWLVLGPFDGPKGKALDTAYPPESAINLGSSVQTRAGAQTWRLERADVGASSKTAVLDFTRLFSPKDWVVAYALVHVKAPVEMNAKLLLGSDDQVKVWLNGAWAHSVSRNRMLKYDEDAIPIRLSQGWNRLLFKVCQESGDWGLAVRLADGAGRPIEALRYDAYGDLPGAPRER